MQNHTLQSWCSSPFFFSKITGCQLVTPMLKLLKTCMNFAKRRRAHTCKTKTIFDKGLFVPWCWARGIIVSPSTPLSPSSGNFIIDRVLLFWRWLLVRHTFKMATWSGKNFLDIHAFQQLQCCLKSWGMDFFKVVWKNICDNFSYIYKYKIYIYIYI